MFKLDYWVF